MPVELRTDPKLEPGAYLTYDRKLYEVERYEPTGSNSGKLWVVNCADDQRLWLTAREIGLAILVRAAPAVPDTVDAAAA